MTNNHALIERYIETRLAKTELVESSATVIRRVLGTWDRHVESRPPRAWTAGDVISWVHDPSIRATTSKSRLTKLRPFVHWLLITGALDRDPTLDVGRVHLPAPDPRDLSPAEVSAVLAICPDARTRLIVLLMAHCGLRVGDVARVRFEDVDLRRRKLHVRAKGGRGERTHQVHVPAEAWVALRAWMGARHTGPAITSYHRPERALQPASVGKLVGRLIRDAGLKVMPWDGISPHSFRHSCAQHMQDRGADPIHIQHTLGHKSLSTTERYYLRHEPPGLREAVEGRSYGGVTGLPDAA
jgi:integrase/recombinase XerD